MQVDQNSLIQLFSDKSLNDRLDIFYQIYGVSIRSEYRLEDEDIVDLDWEPFGCVITLVNDEVDQVRLNSLEDHHKAILSWIDSIRKNTYETINEGCCQICFELRDDNLLESVVIKRAI